MPKSKKALILVLLLAMLINPLKVGAIDDGNGIIVDRIFGPNRFYTSVEVSKKTYKGSKNVILVGSNAEIDALSSNILAGELDAPILFTEKDEISKSVKDELNRLKVSNIYIIGGEIVVSKELENKLEEKYKVRRIAGDNRASTSVKVIEEAGILNADEAYLVGGYGVLADGLAIGPVSSRDGIPVLLTGKDKIPKETVKAIKDLNPKKITIIGKEGAVGKKVENTLPDEIKVYRIGGVDREQTAIKIARKYFIGNEKAIVANGWKYADALVGGQLGSKLNIPIILTNANKISGSSIKYLQDKRVDVLVLGGEVSIANSVIDSIKGNKADKPIIKPKPVEAGKYKVGNVRELEELLKEKLDVKLKNRASSLKVDYYDNDINDLEEAHELVRYITSAGSYNFTSLGGLTITTNKTEVKPIFLDFKFSNVENPEDESYIDSEIKKIVNKIIKPNMKDYEKVEAINKFIINYTTYDLHAPKEGQLVSVLLKEKVGVCAAYARTASRLFDEIGLDNYYITGIAKAINYGWGDHAWNKVKVDGRWYNLDVTWSHPMEEFGRHNEYEYFLVSDERFSKDHIPTNTNIPKSIDRRYDGQYDNDFSKGTKFSRFSLGFEKKIEVTNKVLDEKYLQDISDNKRR